MSGKFGEIIQKARKEENQIQDDSYTVWDKEQSVKPHGQKPSEPEVNLCVKVPKSLRQHWAAEAKRSDITMTSVIVEALTQKFGLPDNQK
ncbi:hypothetical protein IQ219_01430 [Synechocystis sp. LEGE 06083]|uniref:hypothetical protein n=1 Tax=Synechocystis sp. LEGE 06083 TaxID=915336 RepID=UPI0018823B0B|nr:hypothetical protein [Synechocystis sp. LEGE 06083]MBE9194013.1 hypothetical protein [Synechocystis sp. LEGE 06083]